MQLSAPVFQTVSGWCTVGAGEAQPYFADCKPAPVAPTAPKWAKKVCNEKKDENPMANYAAATVVTADSIEKDQRKMLRSRAYDAFDKKVFAARKQFNIDSEEAPDTMKEFISRIQNGQFEYRKDVGEDAYAGSFWYNIVWRDPKNPADKEGYKKAREELRAAFDALDLRLAIIPVADALAELEAYIKA